MSAYQVRLEIFEGPLDLLLYLIKRDDMEIKDIPISQITQEYLSYIELMKDLNLELAGDFLVMAATLLQIKSKMLLPQDPKPDEQEGPDPRSELIAKLLEYQKYKEAAQFLVKREQEYREVYFRNVTPVFSEDEMTLHASLFDLLAAFRNVLVEAPAEVKELIYEKIPLEQRIREVLDLLDSKEYVPFEEIFVPGSTRRELIVTFLALLELVRMKQAVARQAEHFGEIRIYRVREPVVQDGEPTNG